MKRHLLLSILLIQQVLVTWGQTDTLSYESIMNYYNRKTNMIEFYQLSENFDKVSELTKERDNYIDALEDNYGKGLFYYILSDESVDLGNYDKAIEECSKAVDIYKKVLGVEHPDYAASLNDLACKKAR